jgi:hypothetical protein
LWPSGIMFVFVGNPKKQAKHSLGFLNRYYVIIAKCAGAVWGDRHSPLRYLGPVSLYFTYSKKRNSPEPKKDFNGLLLFRNIRV